LQPLGTQLEAKVIRPFLAQGVQSRSLQKPILVCAIFIFKISHQSLRRHSISTHKHAHFRKSTLWCVVCCTRLSSEPFLLNSAAPLSSVGA